LQYQIAKVKEGRPVLSLFEPQILYWENHPFRYLTSFKKTLKNCWILRGKLLSVITEVVQEWKKGWLLRKLEVLILANGISNGEGLVYDTHLIPAWTDGICLTTLIQVH
jgi:hypothetical protein